MFSPLDERKGEANWFLTTSQPWRLYLGDILGVVKTQGPVYYRHGRLKDSVVLIGGKQLQKQKHNNKPEPWPNCVFKF